MLLLLEPRFARQMSGPNLALWKNDSGFNIKLLLEQLDNLIFFSFPYPFFFNLHPLPKLVIKIRFSSVFLINTLHILDLLLKAGQLIDMAALFLVA
jgi:hypothetical protein